MQTSPTGARPPALRWLGDGHAPLTVLHDERLTIAADADRYALTDSANWKLWVVDVEGRSATPLDTLGWHAPGLCGARVAAQTYLFVPTADYASTATYLYSEDGNAELRWQAPGWQTRLFELELTGRPLGAARHPDPPRRGQRGTAPCN